MISFRQFLIEMPNWMYHGTLRKIEGGKLKVDRHDFSIDRALGSHFASDKSMADKFGDPREPLPGKTHSKDYEPGVYRTKAPSRSKLHKLDQTSNGWDQHAIGSHITGTVFSKPENKELFKTWVKHTRHVDDKTAEEVHSHLMAGKAPSDKKFGTAAASRNSFKSYMHNFDAGLIGIHSDLRAKVVNKYIEHMKSKGKHGLVYRNTSPNETQGVRSKKSYIMFEPEHLPIEKVKKGT